MESHTGNTCLRNRARSRAAHARRFDDPFATLKHLECKQGPPHGHVLVVMPFSGHHAALIRDLVLSFAETHEVSLLDWRDARDVPAHFGPFDFDDEVGAIVEAISANLEPVHVVGICQSGLPVLTAATALAARGVSGLIKSLTFLGVPFFPTVNPTNLSKTLETSVRAWLEYTDIRTLRSKGVAEGRRVYPGAMQRERIQNYVERQTSPCSSVCRKLRDDDGLDPDQYPFHQALTALKDTPADVFLDNIDRYYHRTDVGGLVLEFGGRRLDPECLADLPILTVEGAHDDIVGLGQTSALHERVPHSTETCRETFTVLKGGHFDLFHGRICRETVVPKILSFLAKVEPQARPVA